MVVFLSLSGPRCFSWGCAFPFIITCVYVCLCMCQRERAFAYSNVSCHLDTMVCVFFYKCTLFTALPCVCFVPVIYSLKQWVSMFQACQTCSNQSVEYHITFTAERISCLYKCVIQTFFVQFLLATSFRSACGFFCSEEPYATLWLKRLINMFTSKMSHFFCNYWFFKGSSNHFHYCSCLGGELPVFVLCTLDIMWIQSNHGPNSQKSS